MRFQAAFTLIEVVVTIVVLAIAATALIGVYSNMVRGSADPVIQQQAISVAESYMEEILRKAYADPFLPETGSSEAAETRASFNDLRDYNDLPDNLVRDQNNNPVPGLGDYTVTVNVLGDVFGGVNMLRIEVSVTHPLTGTITLNSFRADY